MHNFYSMRSVGIRSLSTANFSRDGSLQTIRLSKLLAKIYPNVSRRKAERSIKQGHVLLNGETNWKNDVVDENIINQSLEYHGIKVNVNRDMFENPGKRSSEKKIAKVWAVNKLAGELVTHHDPEGRPSLIERLQRGGGSLSKFKHSLKSIGRLDMNTEGLILITTCGKFAQEMEHPSNALHRQYRVRIHGKLTPKKLNILRQGMTIDGFRYKGMGVKIENLQRKAKSGASNIWLQIKCVEGKNRQIRKCLEHIGLNVTRLIRTQYGDYDLHSIPPGMAIEVPMKPLDTQRKRGSIELTKHLNFNKKASSQKIRNSEEAKPVQWIHYSQS